MSIEDHRKRRRERELQTCKHFRGVQYESCCLGIFYKDVEAEAPALTGRHLPCLPNIKSGTCEGQCTKREFPTTAEVEADEAALKKSIESSFTARAAIVERIGPYVKRKSPNAQGSLPCPICKTGTLHFTRAAYNGHIHAACTTSDCVRWME